MTVSAPGLAVSLRPFVLRLHGRAWPEGARDDLRYAIRVLRRTPGFAAALGPALAAARVDPAITLRTD